MKQLIKQLLRESLLDEGKFIGSLYHYTRLESAIKILYGNHMLTHTERWITGIPMTRDKDFWKEARSISGIQVRFEFDASKISNNFKIKPFNAFNIETRSVGGVESEERIIVRDIRDFRVLDYLLNITINLDKIIYDIMKKSRVNNGKNDESINQEIFNSLFLENIDKIKSLKNIAKSKSIPVYWKADMILKDDSIPMNMKIYLQNIMEQ